MKTNAQFFYRVAAIEAVVLFALIGCGGTTTSFQTDSRGVLPSNPTANSSHSGADDQTGTKSQTIVTQPSDDGSTVTSTANITVKNAEPSGTPGGDGTTPASDGGVIIGGEEVTTFKDITLQCLDGMDASVGTVNYTAPAGQKIGVRFNGQFCPSSTNILSIMFVVDFSGSMSSNDPYQNGTCGRLDGARAIFNRMQSIAQPGDRVAFAIVPFGSMVATPKIIQFTDMASFQSQLVMENFCRYIGDGNPPSSLSVAEAGTDGNTNYEAPFQVAEQMLSGRIGRNEVFFITDGEPNLPGSDPVGAAAAAGLHLRQTIGNLTLSSLLLHTTNASAQDILTQVSGSPDQVQLVANASQLAQKILDFPAPAIDMTSLVATRSVPSFADENLYIDAISQIAPEVWSYMTQAFVLKGTSGQSVANTIVVTAKGTDGSSYQSTVTINYVQN